MIVYYSINAFSYYSQAFLPYAHLHEEKPNSKVVTYTILVLYNIGMICQVLACVSQLFEWSLIWMMVQFQHRDELDTEVIVNRVKYHSMEKKLMVLYIFLSIIYIVYLPLILINLMVVYVGVMYTLKFNQNA